MGLGVEGAGLRRLPAADACGPAAHREPAALHDPVRRSIIIVGGIKTVGSGGGGYGELNLMVANNSGLYEGSTISTVAIAIIPLILWFTKYGTIFPPDWKVKVFAGRWSSPAC
jgi:hypothetical protein